MASDDEGFSLVELLVVVLIIGLLAIITIPTYLSQREQGWRVSAKADLRNLATEVEDHLVSLEEYPADQADFDALLDAASAFTTTGVVKLGTTTPGVTYIPLPGGYCLTAGHVGIDNGNTVVAAYSGMGPGLLDPPTADCS